MKRGPPWLLPALFLPTIAGADPAPALDEVLVTARRVAEPMLDVPLALQVLPAAVLERSSVDGLAMLAARAPGLSFESTWGGGFALPTVRGQFAPSLGDTVGLFVDGVYQASRNALDVELLDIARVEVAFGPQGALYGNSTFAGAIAYVPNAPTADSGAGVRLDAGSGDYYGAQGWLSLPLSEHWLARIAAGARQYGGQARNQAGRGDELGGFERQAVAATLASSTALPYGVSLSARYQDGNSGHPPASFVDGEDYNCGSRDVASGLWSYYCGQLPDRATYDISPRLPDSDSRVGQVALRVNVPVGALRLDLDASHYDASTDLVRDFDGSSRGVQYGVCTSGVNCSGSTPRLVNRIVSANEVARDLQDLAQTTLAFRVSGSSGALAWMAGGVAIDTEDRVRALFGVERGDLLAGERLTALLPATPQQVGPVSVANQALVDDPAAAQSLRQDVATERRTYAAFGTVDYAAGERWRLRAELRGTRETQELDSRTVNFQPSFGSSIPAQDFEDVTARLSAEYRPTESLRGYLSAARGSRPGGVNPIPGLPDDEQSYEPESNWTYELGLRYQADETLRRAAATFYYIDWRDTQINGLPSVPGLNSLILLNTAGLTTRGVELSLDLAPASWLTADLALSLADPEFRAGSDDYGSSSFCGLSPTSQTSTFCRIGPPRQPNANSPALLPWLDGNAPGRAPRVTWHAGLTAEWPGRDTAWRPWLRLDLNHQDDVYERQIDGARFGGRTLLDARAGVGFGAWSLEAWGTNLAGENYVEASFSRLPVFYPTQPRPLDLLYADGRRYGLTVRWSTD
jgi:iron complex outermembrane recepter protein